MHVRSILLAETSPLFRAGLATVLKRIKVSVTLLTDIGPLEKETRKYNAILVDAATYPGDDGHLGELIQKLARFAPVVVLAREDRIDQIITCSRAGATGLVRQTASARNLRDAIRAAANGNAWCDGQIFQVLTRYLLPIDQRREPRLTKREEEVLRCLAHGQGNKEIAASLVLSEQSVKVYVSNLLRKLGVPNRSWLALHALTRGTEVA